MPRPRFQKLSDARRTALLEAAAQEFGAHGFERASINRILEHAGVSKGAAYYYFDDKVDLFLTVVRYYMSQLEIQVQDLPEKVTAETFWPAITDMYRHAFIRSRELPWAFGVWKAAGEIFRSGPADNPLACFAQDWLDVFIRLFRRGQALGAIRSDLPDELLMSWVRAIDDAHDQWMLTHWDELDAEAMSAAAERMVDALRRLVGTDYLQVRA
jgi:AcrR family transcriptional regulator